MLILVSTVEDWGEGKDKEWSGEQKNRAHF